MRGLWREKRARARLKVATFAIMTLTARLIAVPVALQRYVDAPPLAIRQRDVALALAKECGAKVIVLSSEADLGLLPQAMNVGEKLAAYAQPLAEAGISVDTRVFGEKPSVAIPKAIADSGADLAIIGTHHKRSAIDIDLGSTASSLVRELKVPIILVRPTPADEEQAKKMTVPHYPAVFTYL
jgi:nucleotide-binding universal stress UspA family protein